MLINYSYLQAGMYGNLTLTVLDVTWIGFYAPACTVGSWTCPLACFASSPTCKGTF